MVEETKKIVAAWEQLEGNGSGSGIDTQRMRVHGGYLYRTSTQQENTFKDRTAISEALCFVPGPEEA